jgi:hypothetical protein
MNLLRIFGRSNFMTIPKKTIYLRTFAAKADEFKVSHDGDEDDSDAEEEKPVFRGERPKIKERNIDAKGRGYGTGRRKTSIARVWVYPGCGQVSVNGKNIIDYFQFDHREHSLGVFLHSKTSGFFDVYSTVKGGGKMGMLL